LGDGLLFALSLLAYTVGWGVLAYWWMRRRRQFLVYGIALFLGAAAMGALLFHRQQADRIQPIVVIAADRVHLRKGNSFLYPPRYDTPLNRGVEAHLLFAREGWLQIQLAGGEVGWVPAADTVHEDSPLVQQLKRIPPAMLVSPQTGHYSQAGVLNNRAERRMTCE
jgi:hypothetical protein